MTQRYSVDKTTQKKNEYWEDYDSSRNKKTPRTLSNNRVLFLGLGTLVGKCGGDDGRILGDFGACCRPELPFPGFTNADSWLAGLVTGSPRITCDKLLRRRFWVSGSLSHSRNSSSTLVFSVGCRAITAAQHAW